MSGPTFTAEAEALGRALRVVREVVERANTIVILSNVLIEADAAGTVRLTCSNLDLMATRVIPASVQAPGAITVPAHRFTDVVSALEKGAQVECAVGNGQMQVRSGRSRFRFSTLPAADFPGMVFPTAAAVIDLPARTLHEALGTVKPAISSEEIRYYLCGVLFHLRGDRLSFAATDGHRLARVAIPAPDGLTTLPDTIVGAEMVNLIHKHTADVDATARVEIAPDKIRFTIAELAITAKAVEGTYPDYTRVIPSRHQHKVVADRDALRAGLSRVLIANDDKSRSVKLTIEPSSISISCASASVDGREEVPCEAELAGGSFEIGFNGRYLMDLLGVLDVDSVELTAADAVAPTLISSPSRPDATIVLMPMRV